MGLAQFVPPLRIDDLPGEPGQWVEIKKLSGRQMRKVRKAAQAEVFETARSMGPEMMASLQAVDADAAAAAMREARSNPLQGLDVDQLLELSIVAWSYDAAVTPDNIGDMEETTREHVALRAATFSGRRSEDDTKND